MPKNVTVPNVGEVEFPDSMDETAITRAIETDILPHATASPDVRGSIQARKVTPPIHRFGDAPEAATSDVSTGEAAKAIRGGVLSGLGIPTSVAEVFGFIAGQVPGVSGMHSSIGVMAKGYEAYKKGASLSEVGDVMSAAEDNPVRDLLGPAKASVENRPPTKAENLSAIRSGSQLGTMILAPKVIKAGAKAIGKLRAQPAGRLKGKGVAIEATPEPVAQEAAPAPAKTIAEMTPDELRTHAQGLSKTLNESEVVPGMANRRAWNTEIRGTTQHVASVDIDNLKAVNDKYGHLAGDSLIAANGEALRLAAEENGAKAAHISGDELKVAHDDPVVLQKVVDRAHEILGERGIFYENADGQRVQVPPEAVKGFSHGIGPNEAAAEEALRINKTERRLAGLRDERSPSAVDRRASGGGEGEAGREVRTGTEEGSTVTVHRGVPAGADEALRPLDSVTTDRSVAEQYAGQGGKVVSHDVPAEHLKPVMGSETERQFVPPDQTSTIENMPAEQLEMKRTQLDRRYREMENDPKADPRALNDLSNQLADIEAQQEARSKAGEQPTEHRDAMNPVPVEQIGKVAKKFAPIKEFMEGVNPVGASEGAASAGDILRESKAKIANDATIERYGQRQITKQFSRASDAENIENISTYERTGQFKNAPAGYSEFYRDSTNTAHEKLRDVYGNDRVGFVDNYVRRAFKFGSAKDAQRASGVLSNWIGSLSANKSPIKGRVLSVPLDEALSTMKANGIDVRMATTNPELLRQWTVENANQAKVYKQAWTDASEGGLISYVPNGKRVPQGFIPLNDRVATTFFASEKGPVLAGKYFAEPGVARIFNNAISQGLGGSPTFRSIRAINNTYNQFQLGLSGFHLTGTAINATISDVSLGLQQILQGDIAGGAKSIGRSPIAFARDMYKGNEFIKGLLADDPVAKKFLDERLNPAGGRLAIDSAYRTQAYENMVNAWNNRRFLGAIGRVPLAIVQKVSQPLMEYAIPRVKLGAFMDLAEVQLKKLGAAATDVERQRALEQAWDSIDNRFGQLVHDNLFWNRTASDLAQVSTRSVGWNLGTVREIGGGVLDLAKGKVTPRALYSFSLPLVAGTIGAVYQYLHTGKRPESLKDYFYPRNGLTDDRGRDDRITLPTYMKDEYAYTADPVSTVQHKASPILAMAADLATNRDYYGDMIRNPDESLAKKRFQDGAYILKNIVPFSIQQAMKTAGEGGGAQAAEQFFGFVKAPSTMKNTNEENAAMRERRRQQNEIKMDKAAQHHGGALPEWMQKLRDRVSP
jgi:GGDEF domain-containing protein